jgi:hypothetical protein
MEMLLYLLLMDWEWSSWRMKIKAVGATRPTPSCSLSGEAARRRPAVRRS